MSMEDNPSRKHGKTNPRTIRKLEKASVALAIRATEGRFVTYDEIAKRAGYCNRSGAYRAVAREVDKICRQSADYARVIREQELSDLNDLLSALWDQAMLGDINAVEASRRLLVDRRKLQGVEEIPAFEPPKRDDVLQRIRAGLMNPTAELAQMLAECGWTRKQVIEVKE